MNTEQLLTQNMTNMQRELSEIKAWKETWKEIGMKRLDENNNISIQIAELTTNIKNLTEQLKGQNEQLKGQNERFDRMIDTVDSRFKAQGERIGEHIREQVAINQTHALIIEKLTKRVDDHDKHIDEFRMRGSKKLSFIVDKIIYVAVGIAVMYVLYRFGFGG